MSESPIHSVSLFQSRWFGHQKIEMASGSGELIEMKEQQTFFFDGNKIQRFKAKTRSNKVNFRDDTMIQRRCCSEQDLDIGSANDLEMGLQLPEPEDYQIDENQLTVMTLPVEFMRRPSMASVRNKRDQLFQGTRARRNPRVIFKSGFRNITFRKLPRRSLRLVKDFVTTLIEEQWRYTLLVFALSFFCSWLMFAFIWYVIALSHGDLDFDPISGRRLGDGPQPCVQKAKSLAGFLLFSIETQMGIGFGDKYPTEECPEAVLLVILQSIIGVAIEGAMVGIVFAKMTRPSKVSSELKFSKKAAVCLRDGKLCLLFRVCDFRQKHVISTRVRAFFFDEKKSKSIRKTFKYLKCNLNLENDGKLFLIWPTTVTHVIDKKSPLWNYSAKDLLEKRFEIVVTIIGSSPSTGQLSETRSSYLSNEILWGHRFVNMITYDYEKHTYVAHYDRLDTLVPVDTPLCSAKKLKIVYDEYFNFSPRSSVSCPRRSLSPMNYSASSFPRRSNDLLDDKYVENMV